MTFTNNRLLIFYGEIDMATIKSTDNLATTSLNLETGTVIKFFSISLSLSMKNRILATTLSTHGKRRKSPNVTTSLKSCSKCILSFATNAVKEIGKRNAANMQNKINFCRLILANSQIIKSSNSLTSGDMFKIIL